MQTAAPGTSLYKLRKQALVRRDVLTMVNEVSEGAYAVFFGKKAFESIIHHIYGTVVECGSGLNTRPVTPNVDWFSVQFLDLWR